LANEWKFGRMGGKESNKSKDREFQTHKKELGSCTNFKFRKMAKPDNLVYCHFKNVVNILKLQKAFEGF
jgi:hypothetical protein